MDKGDTRLPQVPETPHREENCRGRSVGGCSRGYPDRAVHDERGPQDVACFSLFCSSLGDGLMDSR